MDFIVAAANLRAIMYGIKQNNDRKTIASIADMWTYTSEDESEMNPDSENIEVNPEDGNVFHQIANVGNYFIDICVCMANSSYTISELRNLQDSLSALNRSHFNIVEIELDEDNNCHIDFITSACNLRAECYGLPHTNRFQVNQTLVHVYTKYNLFFK